jgi:hypothetical protein
MTSPLILAAAQEGTKLGLRAAATFLECTADDYDEMAARIEKRRPGRAWTA